MRWANRAMFFVNLCLFVAVGWLYFKDGIAPRDTGFDWKDYTAILLTVVTIVLAAVGLFVAVAAIWGYAAIKQHAEDIARKTARDTARAVAQSVAARASSAAEAVTADVGGDETEALTKALMAADGKEGGGNVGN